MADVEGSIMQKIMAITAPPHSSPSSKQRTKKARILHQTASTTAAGGNTSGRQARVDNHSYCDACGDGGDLLCCDHCPSSFHFGCCDPPLKPESLPDGEWLCQGCRPVPASAEDHTSDLFRPLLVQACLENPQVFMLPDELQEMTNVADVKRSRRAKQDPSDVKTCYFCDRGSVVKDTVKEIVSCDFCPLSYHLDCLDPPLTHPPISASWMCPNHAERAMPGLHSSRLTERLKSLQKSRVDVSHHAIKIDFLNKLKQIPPHKRTATTRINRRATEVPGAIKAMYSYPTQDSVSTPPLVDILLTATEYLEMVRREGMQERERLQLSPPPLLTEEQDEKTRTAILCHLENKNACPPSILNHQTTSRTLPSSSLPSSNNSVHPSVKLRHKSVLNDLKEIFGADLKDLVNGPAWSKMEGSPVKRPLENGLPVASDDGGSESESLLATDDTDGDVREECLRPPVADEIAPVCGSSSPIHVHPQQPEESVSAQSKKQGEMPFVPDVSQLDDHLIRLLARERIQQLFAQHMDQEKPSSSATAVSIPPTLSVRTLNGMRMSPATPTTPSTSASNSSHKSSTATAAGSAVGLLCPLTSPGYVHLIQKSVVTIGAGADMDVSLHQYSHCLYISNHHACLLYDKETEEFELVNYSEHGSIVDGVLYSCDFSDKSSGEGAVTFTLDDLTAQGEGIRAEKARRRMESARKCLQDRDRAQKSLQAALQLSKSICKDCVINAQALSTGRRKRKLSSDSPECPSSPSSSVVSIPLSKAHSVTLNHQRLDPPVDVRERERIASSSSQQRPCVCKRSASSVIGSEGKGWEGAAIVYHGSKLRFGCIQLVLSVAGRAGHSELLQSLTQANLL